MQKTVYEIFENNIKTLIKELNNCKILIAYSGGLDSTVLLDLFLTFKKKYNIRLFVCYINHNLRGDESSKEANFVKKMLEKLDIEDFFIESVPSSYWKNIKAKSIEMAAREIRYQFFHKICKIRNIDYIATAHHFQDRIETFFLNLIRGTGIESLRSIPIKNKNVIRPLLNISKERIVEYATQNSLEYITDSSNYKDIYKRNIVRNKILPVLKILKNDYEKSFKHVFHFLEENYLFITYIVKYMLSKIIFFKSKAVVVIDSNIFKKKSIYLQKEIVKYILKKIKCKNYQSISLFKILNRKRIIYEKEDLIINSKFKFLYFINKKFLSKLKINDEIIIKDLINTTIKNGNLFIHLFENQNADYKSNLVFDMKKVLLPIYIRSLKDNDEIFILGKYKNIKKMLKKDIGIPDFLIPYTIILRNYNNEIIAFIINNIFRVSEKYFVKDNSKRIVFKVKPLF